MNIVRLFFVFFIFCSHISLIAQSISFEWANQASFVTKDMTIDNQGNIYRTGYFYGTVDMDPGLGIVNLTPIGENDIFIQKLDPDGNLLWAKSFGGVFGDWGRGISVDNNGNVFTCGTYKYTVDFDPGIDTFNMTSYGNSDMFVQKLDSNGFFIWAKSIDGTYGAIPYDMDIDASGKLYIIGSFRETVDFNPGIGVRNLTAEGFLDVFIQKLSNDGDLEYIKQMKGPGSNEGRSICVNDNGEAYVSGYFQQSVDFDPELGVEILISQGVHDQFFQKLDTIGNLLWVKQLNPNSYLFNRKGDIYLDNNENLYITSNFIDTMDADVGPGVQTMICPGNDDVCVLKLNKNGQFIWAKQIGGYGKIYAPSLYTNNSGDLYLTGNFDGEIDFNPNSGNTILNSLTANDAYILQLDSNGNHNWVRHYGGLDSNYVFGTNIVVNDNEDAYVAGSFLRTIDFNPGTQDYFMNSINGGGYYLQKFASCSPSQSIDIINVCSAYTWINGVTYTTNNSTATYNIIGGASSGCDSIITLNLNINQSSNLSINQIGSTIISNNSVASYVWLDCDNNFSVIPGETSQSYTSTSSGNYAVELTENGCVDTSECAYITPLSLLDHSLNESFTVYPNPNQGEFSIQFKKVEDFMSINIYTILGQKVNQFHFENESEVFLQIEGEPGVYILELQSVNKENVYIRVVKH